MKKTDIVIIGAGIVGCSISYILNKNNIQHILLEKSKTIFDNASGCAGAFVTPHIGQDSDIHKFQDKAFSFSAKFYNNFNSAVSSKSTISLVGQYNEKYEKETRHIYKKVSAYNQKGYLFENALCIDPLKLARQLIKDSKLIYDFEVKTLNYTNKQWTINNDITASKVILTTGFDTSLIDEPYISLRGLLGTKIDIKSTTDIPTSINKGIYFSKSKNNIVSIGATHHRVDSQETISKEKDAKYLLDKLQNIVSMRDIQIQQIQQGTRSCSKDYFPIVGNIIDSKKTIEKYPSIKHGTKIPKENMIYKENLFICNGVGGKGFTLAPYIADILVSNILHKKPIVNEIDLYKRFLKYARSV